MLASFGTHATPAATAVLFLIEATLKGTVVLALAALLAFALRRSSAAHRHLVWACALAGLVALPVSLLLLPAWRVKSPSLPWVAPGFGVLATAVESRAESPTATDAAAIAAKNTTTKKWDEAKSLAEDKHAASPTSDATTTVEPKAAADDAKPVAPSSGSPFAWTTIAVALWAIGALAVLATFAAGHVVLRLMLRGARPVREGEWLVLANEAADRLGLTAPFALLRTDGILVPVATGIIRPRVLLPTGADAWPPELRRAVLLHELAHVQRHDCLTQAIAQLACAAFWFHPAVWWATSRLQTERERACDDRVLAARTKASDYADHLLGMVRSLRTRRLAALGAVAFARPSSLEGRLLAVLDPRRDRRGVGRRAVVPAALAAALLVLPFAALEPVAVGNALADGKHKVRTPLPTDPNAFRPSRLVAVPEPSGSLAERTAWARTDADRKNERVWWVGWQIETSPTLKGNLLSDSHGISLTLLGRRGAFTLEDILAGRSEGTANPEHGANDDGAVKPAVVLIRMSAGAPDRVRVQTPQLPADFRGEPFYWMGAVGDEQSFAWLKGQAEHAGDDRLRARFVESVGFMGRSELVAPWLTATFQNASSDEVRIGAAEGLSRHPSREGVKLMANAARSDRSPDVRRACVEALGQFQTKEALEALLLIARASEGGDGTRHAVFDALGEKVSQRAPEQGDKTFEYERAVGETWTDASEDPPAAADAADEPAEPKSGKQKFKYAEGDEPSHSMPVAELEVQRQAIESLGRYPEAQSLPRLKKIAETSPNGDLRAQAVESIARLGTQTARELIEQIVWKNSMERARDAAVEMLGRHPFASDQSLETLARIAHEHPSMQTRRMAVETLGRLDSPRVVETLGRIAQDGVDVDTRRQAVESLGRQDGPEIEPQLIEIARSHPEPDVRRQAVESLGRRAGPEVERVLFAIARDNSSIDARRQAVESLGRRDGSAISEQLLAIARGDSPVDIQRQAVESLGRRDEPRTRGWLLTLVRSHPSTDVQRQAVESLGRLEADVMPDLEEIARSHPSGEIRRQAVESMTRRDPDRALAILEKILQKSE